MGREEIQGNVRLEELKMVLLVVSGIHRKSLSCAENASGSSSVEICLFPSAFEFGRGRKERRVVTRLKMSAVLVCSFLTKVLTKQGPIY